MKKKAHYTKPESCRLSVIHTIYLFIYYITVHGVQ